MAKRRLSRQQQWRIDKIQQEKTERANRRANRAEESLDEGALEPEQRGLVIAHFGTQVEIEGVEGKFKGEHQRCHLRANLPALVTGDIVIWRPGTPTGVVVAHETRHNLLSRPDNHGQIKPVAANIDYIVIVIASEPTPHANLIDRYLVAAESVDIEPIILLNKTDLINDDNRDQIEALLSIYPDLGYRVIEASTVNHNGLSALKKVLNDKTSVFVGQSGVGKSSLINVLLPGTDARVGGLSKRVVRGSAKGTHTTTTAQLFHFPDGGDLIDSPGIREFGLWHIDKPTLLEGFREFRPYLGYCRFRDCQHEQEPGCALHEALEKQEISERRMNSYRRILQELEQED
jgi:ribosome biogenesis GTPase